LAWPISVGAFDADFWSGLVGRSFERASPAEIDWRVLGGGAVEMAEPLLEAALTGVDVVDVQVRRLRREIVDLFEALRGVEDMVAEMAGARTSTADLEELRQSQVGIEQREGEESARVFSR
jgi:hypothetical protein